MRIGRTLGHFEILELLGEGGMGEVYVARDLDLKRRVALKVLPEAFAADEERLSRFQREAETVARLNHPNIVTIFSIEKADDVRFLTMELVDGETLAQVIPEGGLPLERFFALARQLVRGVAAAHRRGVIHRDLKPANVMVDHGGRVKILDFGLAKLRGGPGDSGIASDMATALKTVEGRVLGTPAYMAPEQAEGKPADTPADVFGLGAVLYLMLTGQRAFTGDTLASLQAALLTSEPEAPGRLRPELPADLSNLVVRCLAKDPAARPASAVELAEELEDLARAHDRRTRLLSTRSGRTILAAAGLLLLAAVAGAGWMLRRNAIRDEVRNETIPEIQRLVDARRTVDAFTLARESLEVLPQDPVLLALVAQSTGLASVSTEPPGATISYRDYLDRDSEWLPLGVSPLDQVRLPADHLRFKIEKEGFVTLEAGDANFGQLSFELRSTDETPEHMRWVPEGPVVVGREERRTIAGFWLDQFEVTNREYKAFVAAGGYTEETHWREPFAGETGLLSFATAIAEFVDSTGRPGPATWELGTYPDGTADHPVSGVSWFEAAAYARFVGKSLPTAYHWRRSAPPSPFGDMELLSNFNSEGTAPVGSSGAVGPYGHFDLAGNVSEWTRNESAERRRLLLGGAWSDPDYRFADLYGRSPFYRGPDTGFRCASYPTAPPPELEAPIVSGRFDFRQVEPVPDETFEFYRRLYEYEPKPLAAELEEVDESSPHWRRETVSFTPAYDGERMLAHLFLPRAAAPPYQTIVWAPGMDTRAKTSVDQMLADPVLFLARSGRALVLPAYYGTLERGGATPRDRSDRGLRDGWVRFVNDLQRTVDYLQTRDDVDADNLGYFGLSLGSEYGPLLTAIEKRLRAIVFLAGGFDDFHMLDEPAEINPWHYAPRVTAPTLMINGESDYLLPVETGQKPLFELLGTPPELKRHVVIAGGHLPEDQKALIRETLDWFDRHLGPVR